ncbi:prion-inhibition and propagation-domain-containing protein [Dendryphion nanum]|uniref:Prion-inhibition and propagation-domain-containing protein n=1 Tax=Dendryphion nanum TaxID=256645 RepID=A0A9P9EL61_9PLEO|nr:prion-inhibition and propagation-domain-containing protein [Dendryphion nanum]
MAELTLGAVSLTFQIFSGIVQGYQLITDAKHMPSDCQYLRVRLKTEQYRLLDWADVVRLDETDDNLLISNATKGLLLDVFDQQDRLLRQFGRLDEKYKKLSKPLLSDDIEANGALPAPPDYSPTSPTSPTVKRVDSDFQRRFPRAEPLLNKSIEYAKKSLQFPRRLKWVSFDKAKVELLVLRLSSFNDFMREMLTTAQLETLADKQTRTEFQIMQLNSSVQDLVQIVASTALTLKNERRRSKHPTNPLNAFLEARGLEDIDEEKERDHGRSSLKPLAKLAQFKALNSAIEDPNLFTDEFTHSLSLRSTASQIRSVELSRADIHIDPKHLHSYDNDEDDDDTQRIEATYQRPHSNKTSVWIEWKTYEPPTHLSLSSSGAPDPKIHSRIIALAALLKENNQTDQFRAPRCLGYFTDIDPDSGDDHYRFGLVFEKPPNTYPLTRPTSLHSLLTNDKIPIPSLTHRITLMRLLSETLERLHAVNWLHKGLRSANILFFSDSGPEDVRYDDPYISGFDYSRPALNDDMTEKPPESAREDIYRHPRVQGSGNREGNNGPGYKKSYDLYSLGVVLLEIAYWKPIDQILGIEDLRSAKPSVTIRAKQTLVSKETMQWVRSHLGERVKGVVEACLKGPTTFGVQEGEDEKEREVGARLQRGFYEKVVKVLGEMRV